MKIIVFLGTVRESTPPRPARLGLRIARASVQHMQRAGVDVELIDPLEVDLPDVFKPQFSYAAGRAPQILDVLAKKIEEADGYVMVSPEYNHSMSPALANFLNHFRSSSFSFKPSAIVTYSAGQWGGARAAVNMRTFLSELGCLPVSAMIHVPRAQEVFQEDGAYQPEVDAGNWDGYMGRTFKQLIWWGDAARNQRQSSQMTEAFDRDPSQRNAP